MPASFTSPRLSAADAQKVTASLQDRLAALIDLSIDGERANGVAEQFVLG